ncbi:dUTP diphosphatase [Gordonia sp. MMO-8]|uniref:dUTP diphosphatase n=1 Tax=Gordonia sp. MMO-8 TaxID=3127886 RepID=UPI003018697D
MTSTLPVKLIDPPVDLPRRYEPTRAHTHDAGLDLYAARTRYIEKGEITGIPLGVAVAIPEGHVGLLMLRSSLGRKGIAMANATGVIDAGYRGELIAQVTAWHDDVPRIEAGERIAQLLVVPIVTPAVEVVDVLPESGDGRGTAGFGSTGR